MSSYTGGEVSVCDGLSGGSLSDSLSVQMVELYCPAIQSEMLMLTVEIETVESSALQMHIECCNGQEPLQH